MRVKYNQKSVDYLEENLTNKLDLEDFSDKTINFFGNNNPIYLEIGPGKGRFIIELAKKNPDKNFIVVELNKTIAGYCLKHIDESELTNIRLVANDFYKMVDLINEEYFDGIFLNFSDPWPKKRHEKRRLTSDPFFKAYYKVLKMNHDIILKSDNDGFFDFSLEQAKKFNYEITYLNMDYKEEDDFDAQTEYETKFLNKGINIKRYIAKKTKETLEDVK